VPPELAAIVARAAGDPPDGSAYRSAAELGRDLTRFLAATGAGGAPPRDPMPAAGRSDPAPAGGPPPRRRRRLPLRAALVAAGLVAGGALAAVALPDHEPGGPTAGSAAAPPRTAVLQTTTGPVAGGRAAPTTAAARTGPPTTPAPAEVTTTTTAVREAGPGQRVVPDVVGLRRAQAAGVLARAQLGMVIQEVPVPESGKAQRVVAQDPPAGEVVPARSDVLVLVATRRPAG
jgi:hypothetical protein